MSTSASDSMPPRATTDRVDLRCLTDLPLPYQIGLGMWEALRRLGIESRDIGVTLAPGDLFAIVYGGNAFVIAEIEPGSLEPMWRAAAARWNNPETPEWERGAAYAEFVTRTDTVRFTMIVQDVKRRMDAMGVA